MDSDDLTRDYLQNRLSPEARAAFEARMEADPALKAEIAALSAAAAELGGRTPPAGAKEAGWARLSASIEAERTPAPANSNRPMTLLRYAAVAAASVALWHFAAGPALLGGGGTQSYVPASVSHAAPALRVTFAAGASMADATALLQSLGAEVSGGPGALGLYTLSFADEAALEAARTALEGRPDLVAAIAR